MSRGSLPSCPIAQFYYEAIDRALEEIKEKHPGQGVHVVGHSIGGARARPGGFTTVHVAVMRVRKTMNSGPPRPTTPLTLAKLSADWSIGHSDGSSISHVGQIDQIDHDRDHLDHDLDHLDHDLDQIDHDLDHLDHDLDHLDHDLHHLDHDLDQIDHDLDHIDHDLDHLDHDLDQIDNDLDQIDHDLDPLYPNLPL